MRTAASGTSLTSTERACWIRDLKNQFDAAREKLVHSTSSAFFIVNAQSVKNTVTAALRVKDAGKNVSGIKRHIKVDTQGLPHTTAVTRRK